jgi:signal transduction histidine kinase
VIIKLSITSLLALLIYFLLSLFSFQSNYNELISAGGALLIFVALYPWLEIRLERMWRPERFIYRQLVEEYGHVVREMSGLNTLLSYVTRTLSATLNTQSVTVWLYQAEDSLLILASIEGVLATHLSELPVDISLRQLSGTQRIAALPESALRQGLIMLGIETMTSLSLRDELVGFIGIGSYRHGRHQPETLQVLDLMAGQLALAVKNARLIADLEETLDKLQLAYQRTIDAQEEERRSLAVELHDDILSRLTTMGMTLSNSQRQLTADTAQVQASLELLGQETHYLNCRLREITQGLHPAILTDLGLIAALQAYMDSLTRHTFPVSASGAIDLTAQGFDGTRINDPKLERDLYYITRQALDNALKHAQAEQIFIHLRWRDDAVTITVQDTGIGLKAAPELLMGQHGHLGLLSLHERVLAWRGRLSFQTGPGQGTTIYARLPINQPSPSPTHLQAFTHYLRN